MPSHTIGLSFTDAELELLLSGLEALVQRTAVYDAGIDALHNRLRAQLEAMRP